jgi:hypothetical protein
LGQKSPVKLVIKAPKTDNQGLFLATGRIANYRERTAGFVALDERNNIR